MNTISKMWCNTVWSLGLYSDLLYSICIVNYLNCLSTFYLLVTLKKFLYFSKVLSFSICYHSQTVHSLKFEFDWYCYYDHFNLKLVVIFQPITWFDFMDVVRKYGLKMPCSKAIWYYCFILTRNIFMYTLLSFLLHTIPAFFMDLGLICIGKSPK